MKLWIEAMRPKTLIISLAPIAIGTVLAYEVHMLVLLATVLCGLGIQIGTNFANDYFDFVQGSDTKERKGPRRLIQAGLISKNAMCIAMVTAFATAFGAGLYLTLVGGWIIFALLVIAIGCGIGYSAGRCSLSRTGLADLFVFVFFGPIATLASFYLQTGYIDWMLLWASIAPGLIPVAVLTTNNLRDHLEDKKCKKKTLVVRFGKTFGQWEFTLCLLAGILAVIPLLWIKLSLMITLGTLMPAMGLIRVIWTFKKSKELSPVFVGTGKALMLYTVLFVIGALL